MANEQICRLIKKAEEEVAEKGMDADTKFLMLAGYGFLGDKIENQNKGIIRIKVEASKKVLAAAFAFGAGVASAVFKFFLPQ